MPENTDIELAATEPVDEPTTFTVPVQVLINNSLDGLRRGFHPDDTFALALSYRVDITEMGDDTAQKQVLALAESAYALTNAPDEVLTAPQLEVLGDYHRRFNSLSVGDVVIIGEVALSCDRLGWKPVALAGDAITTDRIIDGRHLKTDPTED